MSQCRGEILEESLPKALSRVTAHVINAFSLFLFLFRQCHHIRECNVCTKKNILAPSLRVQPWETESWTAYGHMFLQPVASFA